MFHLYFMLIGSWKGRKKSVTDLFFFCKNLFGSGNKQLYFLASALDCSDMEAGPSRLVAYKEGWFLYDRFNWAS